jgi:hypothetical protein
MILCVRLDTTPRDRVFLRFTTCNVGAPLRVDLVCRENVNETGWGVTYHSHLSSLSLVTLLDV